MANLTLSSSPVSLDIVQNQPVGTAVIAGLSAIILLAVLFRPKAHTEGAMVHLPEWFGGLSAWPFFSRRYDFLHGHWSKLKTNLFAFKVLQHTVVAVSGEEGRKVFFNDRHLDFFEGYKIMQGGAPRMEDLMSEKEGYKAEQSASFNKSLASLSSKERLSEFSPRLIKDIHDDMKRILPGKEGIIDPFKNVFHLVVQMTMTNFTCKEIGQSPEVVDKIWEIFTAVETGVTPAALMLPWLPTKGSRNREKNTMAMVGTLAQFIEMRRNDPARTPDSTEAFDILINKGMDTPAIIGFSMILIFAAITNAAVSICWLLIYFNRYPEWKVKVASEMEDLINNHAAPATGQPLYERLATIPLDAWESELPILDRCLRETLRITVNGATLRRNVHGDLPMDGRTVKKGWFLVYSPADIHRDPSVYPNPAHFDPDRHLPEREEGKNVTHGFLGWGAGKHPCTGMRYAKLEIKYIVATFLAGYDWTIVNASGKATDNTPIPDMNDLHRASPKGEHIYFKVKRLVE